MFYVCVYSVKSITQILGTSPHFLNKSIEISQLFIDRFRTDGHAITTEEFTEREKGLADRISKLQHEAARMILEKMLHATSATLRTNFFCPDRY